MKINKKILSIPPHISCTWDQISHIHLEDKTLHVQLTSGQELVLQGLSQAIIDEIFRVHAEVIEEANQNTSFQDRVHQALEKAGSFIDNGFTVGFGSKELSGMDSLLEHNEAQRDVENLAPELLDKITAVSRVLAKDGNVRFPEPIEHCNCPHCQIAHAMARGRTSEEALEMLDEDVSPEDLRFKEWDIHQTAEKLFLVSNPLDPNEQYRVFLGTPLGCTCGRKNCEHIGAVLRT